MMVAINILAFYAGWFGTALLAARGAGPVAAVPCLAVSALHLALSSRPAADAKLMAVAGVLGVVAECALLAAGIWRDPNGIDGTVLPPPWLVALWMAVATLFNVSLQGLKTRLPLAAVLGLLGGPAAYYAGAGLGALTLGEPLVLSVLAIGIVWAVATPLLALVARTLD